MKKQAPWIMLATLLVAVGFARAEDTVTMTGTVTRVVSGDTYEVDIEGKPERVRLNAVAAPLRDQAGSKEAREHAVKLAEGKTVRIELRNRDRNDRIIGTVFLPDDVNLNHEMVRAGHAWHYVRYAPDDEALAALEKAARDEKLGLWAEPNPTPPWEFNKN